MSMLFGGIGSAIAIYLTVAGNVTTLALRMQYLEQKTLHSDEVALDTVNNKAAITELQKLVTGISESNAKMLEQLVGLRVDIGVLREQRRNEVPPGGVR